MENQQLREISNRLKAKENNCKDQFNNSKEYEYSNQNKAGFLVTMACIVINVKTLTDKWIKWKWWVHIFSIHVFSGIKAFPTAINYMNLWHSGKFHVHHWYIGLLSTFLKKSVYGWLIGGREKFLPDTSEWFFPA